MTLESLFQRVCFSRWCDEMEDTDVRRWDRLMTTRSIVNNLYVPFVDARRTLNV